MGDELNRSGTNSSEIILIAHDIRSTHNVGSLLRTAEGLGVSMVYFSGYTPYPMRPDSAYHPSYLGEGEYSPSKLTKGAHPAAISTSESSTESFNANPSLSIGDLSSGSKTSDARLPHISKKLHSQIHKTALGAEDLVSWEYANSVHDLILELKTRGFVVAGLEQTSVSIKLNEFKSPDKLAIVLGREVEGIEDNIVGLCDITLEIPMFGSKESFNVVQAAAMALYHCKLISL